MLAALKVVKRKKLPGGIEVLLSTIPICSRSFERLAVVEALSASARAEDAGRLRAAIEKGPVELRAAAIIALESAIGPQSAGLLRRLLGDRNDLVRLSAIQALSNHSPRECLMLLIDLLESDEARVRIRSAATLRRLTGKRFGFVGGYDNPKFREKAVRQWRNWVNQHGKTAELHRPTKN